MAADFPAYQVGAIPPIGPDTPAELIDPRLLDYGQVLCPAGDDQHSLLSIPSTLSASVERGLESCARTSQPLRCGDDQVDHAAAPGTTAWGECDALARSQMLFGAGQGEIDFRYGGEGEFHVERIRNREGVDQAQLDVRYPEREAFHSRHSRTRSRSTAAPSRSRRGRSRSSLPDEDLPSSSNFSAAR
jgi:hypothetical protein